MSLIRAQVADAILAHAAPALQADLVRHLARPGYALHPGGPCRAGLFALEVYRAVRGSIDGAALAAAAAVELQMQAGCVFDDVADRPPDASRAGRAEDLALAIALLAAATAAAAEAASDAPDPRDAMRHFCIATGEACAGQFLDARLERRGAATLEESLEMTRLKSGSLGTFAAGFAARLAGADAIGRETLERLGFNLFTFAQIVDDQRDARAAGPQSDLAQAKATLPVVFFGQRNPMHPEHRVDGRISPRTCEAYDSSGASAYAAIVALAYLGRAKADLKLLADRGHAIAGLGRFFESLESGATGTLGTIGCGVGA